MTDIASPAIQKEHSNMSPDENKKGIDNHKKAAKHFEAAAKFHFDAARYHEAGNHREAAMSTILAHGQHLLASEAQKEDAKQHALHI